MRHPQMLFLSSILLLAACESQQPVEPGDASSSAPLAEIPEIRPLSESPIVIPVKPTPQESLVADTLFKGLQALDQDRLLTPIDDNAYMRFQKVLAIDPRNEIALDGIEKILLRYVELSREASRRGLFDDAEAFLNRAEFVNKEHSLLSEARALLQSEKSSGDLFFSLDNEDFINRTDAAVFRLGEIAQQAKSDDAFFLITAPNDSLARWMYLQMRSAVGGYRLRGNIELANQISIRLRISE